MGLGDPHKLHGESVNPEHRGVVGGRFVGQNRLWFLTFKSCTAGPRIMSISGLGGWVGGRLGGWAGWGGVGWAGVGWAGQCGWVVCWAGGWLARGFFLN